MTIDYVKSCSNQLHQAGILPPWLWFWFFMYICKLPGFIQFLWEVEIKPLFHLDPLPGMLGNNIIPLLMSLTTIPEVLPFIMMFVGFISILFPYLRRMRVENRYKLTQPKTITPVLQEILEIVQSYAPGVEIKINLLRSDLFAFVYPLGYRKNAIAIFGGLVKLWRSDPEVAKAMILHELGHCRHGDVLMIGAGSFFENLLNCWLLFLVLFFVIPTIIIEGWMLIHSLQESWDLHQKLNQINWDLHQEFTKNNITLKEFEMESDNHWFFNWLWLQIKLFLSVTLPSNILMLATFITFTPIAIIIPLMATWCAEFNADHFVITVQQSPDNLIRGLDKLSPSTSRWKWLLFRLSHPPNKLRLWIACRSMMPKQLLFLFLLFPLAYIVKFLFLLIFSVSMFWTPDTTMGEFLQKLVDYIALGLQQFALVWLTIGVILLLYPKMAVAWEKLFCQDNGTIHPPFYKEYFVSAVIVGCLAAIGYSLSSLL